MFIWSCISLAGTSVLLPTLQCVCRSEISSVFDGNVRNLIDGSDGLMLLTIMYCSMLVVFILQNPSCTAVVVRLSAPLVQFARPPTQV